MKSPYSTVTMVLGTPTFIVRVDLLSFNLRIKVQWLDFGICEFGIKVDFFVGLLEEWTFISFRQFANKSHMCGLWYTRVCDQSGLFVDLKGTSPPSGLQYARIYYQWTFLSVN